MRERLLSNQRDIILTCCLVVCIFLAAATGYLSGRHYGSLAATQNRKLAVQNQKLTAQSERLAAQAVRLAEQEQLSCKALSTISGLLEGSIARQQRALKVDLPAKRAIDRSAIRQLRRLDAGIHPATLFCAPRHP